MSDQSKKIAALNDAFRKTLELQTGKVFMTRGVSQLPPPDQLEVFDLVKTFNNFNEGNDPYGEHDFGAFHYKGDKFFWKFDYYDHSMQYGSVDPADPKKTNRVLTILLAHEY